MKKFLYLPLFIIITAVFIYLFAADKSTLYLSHNFLHKRIISLSPAVTESIYTLEKDKHLVGVTMYCTHPPEAKQKTNVGSLREPNIETIVKLKPDLVITSKEDQKREKVIKIRKLGIPVLLLSENGNFNDIINNFIILSQTLGKENKARKIVKSLKIKLKTIEQKITTKTSRAKVFCALGMNPLITTANGSFLDEAIIRAGGINIAHNSLLRYPVYSIEEVVKQNPDIIILITMNKQKDYKSLWTKYNSIKAVENDKIYTIEADKVCRPTPETFVNTVELFYTLFNKKTNNKDI
ncbi:ABC transporter substrate-binding protein [bacterium]